MSLVQTWLLIIFKISVLENSQEVNVVFVSSVGANGNTLLLGMREYCSARKN